MHFPNRRGHGWKQGWRSGEDNRLPPKCPGSNPGVDAICGLSLLLVLFLDPRGFFSGTTVSPSPQKPTFPNFNSTRSQVGEEPTTVLSGCATYRVLKTGKDSNLLRCTCSVVRKKIPGVRL